MNISSLLRITIKLPLFLLTIVSYFIISSFIYILCGFSFERARPALTRVIAFTSKVGLKIFGIKVQQNFSSINPMENYLIVSNHLSYLDVMIISSFFPSCFITSREMKETFFLGQLCLLGGCLFVDRQNRSNLHNEVRELTDALDDGLNVAIFPEATSTDGSGVIRFRRPLFQAAIDAESKILPICLNYKSINDEKVSLKTRDLMFWYGDMTFMDHVLKLFAQKKATVELTVLSPFYANEFADKVELSLRCHELISSQYTNIVS